MANLIDEFKELREKKHLSQKQVSSNTGVSEITVWTWEAGKRQPTIENFNKVLNKMGYELQIKPRDTIPFYGDNKHLMR